MIDYEYHVMNKGHLMIHFPHIRNLMNDLYYQDIFTYPYSSIRRLNNDNNDREMVP